MLKRLIIKMRESIWFIPSFYSVLASLLSLATVLIDTTFNAEVKDYIPSYLRTSVDLAQTILGTISGALLTMTTITFSTIMVVLTMYSSQFSPRTLQTFLNAPSTQRVLGLFMGGFVYSILSLLFMRKQSITHEVISASVAVFLAVVCLAFFAYFIHKVGTSIQVSRLIRELVEDVLRTIESNQAIVNEDPVVTTNEKPSLSTDYSRVTEFKSTTFGYVQYIHFDALREWAEKNDAVIDVTTPIGSFAGTETTLATVYHQQTLPETDLSAHFKIGVERSTLQDIEYGIEKISEIGLRTLSPGINDPNTAVRCIHSLGEVLQCASRLPGGMTVTYTKENRPSLIVPRFSFKDYLYAAYSQMSFYGRQDASVLNAMLDSLLYIARARSSCEATLYDVRRISEYVWNRFDHSFFEALDTEKLVEKQQTLRLLTSAK
ncbi:DUF2254 domain-containing protein [Sporosarcina aquimarina]|uniref:DUF2254 domain-containing protein n=1 Tax=Sporosarcina aquimarina TaxID=114975 RepID=A0ABU4FYS2_9BACL|nr:DUF2254 domain-containing protein [Sporosarcina aquimarina]MDW0109880.1 DUF2254 domain-containing protein [Sporosarcina aquimarina]